ncbi:hypothetical protein [Telluribacter sp. SYSU D00476]|uniref:hypothetical protein n=1 Tax=Telluribacter sp. SYSU D00476 TaxID=2811430 RepID=UPI001FF46AF7|nr:hypothetical protein [Telluribacter sp. SYSU D00476]
MYSANDGSLLYILRSIIHRGFTSFCTRVLPYTANNYDTTDIPATCQDLEPPQVSQMQPPMYLGSGK